MLSVVRDSNTYAIVYHQGSETEKKLIKSINGREWDTHERYWKIPIINLCDLKLVCARKHISIIVDEAVEMLYYQYRCWADSQLKLKTEFQGEKISGLELKKDLYPFQNSGVRFMVGGPKTINADRVGLGKTVQGIGAVEYLTQNNYAAYTLVICPASLKRQWAGNKKDETGFETFSNQNHILVHGTKKQRNKIYTKILNGGYKHIIISYATMVADIKNDSDFSKVLEFLSDNGFCVILDEIQYIKNRTAQRSTGVLQIASMGGLCAVFGLSATYIELGLEDVFHIFRVIEPSLFGSSYYQFGEKYIDFGFWGQVVGYKNVKDLKHRIAPYVIRRQKEDVLDQLPNRIEKYFWVELTSKQKSIYNATKKELLAEIDSMPEETDEELKKKKGRNRAKHILLLTRLQQVVLSTELLDKGSYSSKLTELIRILENEFESDTKVIIFCRFIKMIEIINRELNKAGIKSLYIHGKHPKPDSKVLENRNKIVDKFSNEDYQVLVSSDVLSTGYDKLKIASVLINFDMLINPAKMEQRYGRIDRCGQEAESVVLIHILVSDTYDEKVYNRVQQRQDLIDNVVDDDYKSDRLTRETIRELV